MDKNLPEQIELKLPNGNTLLCGPGDDYQWGGWVQVLDANGDEIAYWDVAEWGVESRSEAESVMGAIFASAAGYKVELTPRGR